MLLASYKSTRPGLQGWANILIRWRLSLLGYKAKYSHNEIVFQPGDGVDSDMPDGSCLPDKDGALWCFSSVAAERLPLSSPRRPNKVGGTRFKRIKLDSEKWDVVPALGSPKRAAQRAKELEGAMYDWQLIANFLAWVIRSKDGRETCSGACAELLGLADPKRFDTCTLPIAVEWAYNQTSFNQPG